MDLSVFLDSLAGMAIKGMLVAAFLDFAFGVYAAAKDGTFAADKLAAFVRKHLLGRVFPISTLLVIGHFSGDAGAPMLAAGGAAAAAYAVETMASIYGSIRPPAGTETTVEVEANPVPQD